MDYLEFDSKGKTIIGNGGASQAFTLRYLVTPNAIAYRFGSESKTFYVNTEKQTKTIQEGGRLYINGEDVGSVSNTISITNPYEIYLFRDRTTFVNGRIYFVALQVDGYRCTLIPCYRKSDRVAGMYDLVSGVFCTNQGTGEFIVGPDVN